MLSRFAIAETYAGQMEGSRADVSACILEICPGALRVCSERMRRWSSCCRK
jgi:hypothetical protein